jgi:hypothetical protein
MEITTVHSIANAEAVLRDVQGLLTDISLKVATNSRHHVAGGEIAMVQAIITWAQSQQVAKLVTFATGPEDGQLEKLSSHIVGLCAALMCDEAKAGDGTDLLIELRQQALSRLSLLQAERAGKGSRGPQLELLCMDQRENGLPRSIYMDPAGSRAALKDEGSFYEVARVALKRTSIEGAPMAEDEALVAALGDCLYELFRNTHDHARFDIDRNHIPRSIRGIHARRHALSPQVLGEIVKDSPPLAAYCARLRPRDDRRDLQLLEFSVFDSGPGLAARWKGVPVNEIGIGEEFSAVSECFDKHHTTKGIDGRGMGLPIVVAALRERNGFLRVRSGRLSLYADLGLEAEADFGTPPDLRQWSDRRNLPVAAGTLFTFIMPIGPSA